MEIVTLFCHYRVKYEIWVLFVFSLFCLHLLTLTVQSMKLGLKTIVETFHGCGEVDIVLRRNVTFCWQLQIDLLHWSPFFSLKAFQRFEEEGLTVIIGDVIQNSLLNPDVGDLFEIDEKLIGEVKQP